MQSDELTTLTILGSAPSPSRQEYVRHKVQVGCFAGDDPIIHVEHPPHILQPLAQTASAPVSAAASVYWGMFGDKKREKEKEERLNDKVLGRKKKLEAFVELPLPQNRCRICGSTDSRECDSG